MYTLKELSEKLGISYRTLVREVHRGLLIAERKGAMYLVSEDSFKAYTNSTEILSMLNVLVAVVFNMDDLLIVKRKYPEQNLIWQNPSGLYRQNRSPQEQIIDICKSETNANVKCAKKIGSRISPDTKARLTYYLCEYLDGEIYNVDRFHNSEAKWISKYDAELYFTSSIYQRLLPYFRK